MAADRLFPGDLSVVPGLFDPAFDNTSGVPIPISTHFPVNSGRDPAEFAVILVAAAGFDLPDARGCEIGFYFFVYFVEPVQLFLFQRGAGIAILAAAALAFQQVAKELLFNYLITDQNIIDGYHDYKYNLFPFEGIDQVPEVYL